MKRHHTLAALALAALVFVGCGAGTDAANPNYVELNFEDGDSAVLTAPGGPAAAVTVATEPVALTAVDEATLAELTAIYDRFLTIQAGAILSEREVSDLADVATQSAMDQVAGLRADTDAAHAEGKYSAMTDLIEWSNVTTIHERGSDFVFTDCTERSQRNSVGTPLLRFVTNEVVMVPDAGTYKVDQVTVLQGGQFAAFLGDFGCVPPSFIQRAETVAAQAITEAAAVVADPARAVTDGVSDTFSGEAHEELTYIADLLNDQGIARIADESIEISVVGMDTNKPEFTVIVSVCRHYPNGRTYTNTDTGETSVSDLARGSSEEEWLFVQLEPVPVGTPGIDTVTRVESKNSNCWEG